MNITLNNDIYINKYNRYEHLKNNNNNKLYINNLKSINTDIFQKSPAQSPVLKPKFSFTGITRPLEQIPIKSAKDVISQWEKMRFAPYYEALDDKIYPQNKIIRARNFSFLDNLTSDMKKEFLDAFEKFTGFPDLKAVSNRIENEFINQVYSSISKVSPGLKVIAAGYDPTCSVALGKAFPGSDLDKAFVVLRNATGMSDTEAVNQFKGHLWFNTDQRILSLNKQDTFPEVYTMSQIHATLDKLDDATNKFAFTDGVKEYMKNLKMYELDPIKGGIFNISLTRVLPYNGISKEYAKNFAYFLESARDGKKLIINKNYYNTLYYAIRLSEFGNYSNVTQMKAYHNILSSGAKEIKQKLQLRDKLATEYPKMTLEDKFDLVKDIVKGVSGDNDNPKFKKYFENDDDIKKRYDKLNSLLVK